MKICRWKKREKTYDNERKADEDRGEGGDAERLFEWERSIITISAAIIEWTRICSTDQPAGRSRIPYNILRIV